jgi:formamidopyrimidine-DNA glycosylase
MPELPEVETICRGLRSRIRGRRIVGVEVFEARLRETVDPELPVRLRGRTILDVTRRGKYILLELSSGLAWVFHLGMSGKLICIAPDVPRKKHDHIIVTLDNGQQLRYHDPRRFGLSLTVSAATIDELPQFQHLGRDPFSRSFTPDYLYAFTRKSTRRIRDLLLDQQVVAGIGNIYANEILSRVGVRPTTRASRLTRAKVAEIASMIRRVLTDAIRWCGTSFSDYRDADDKFGEFQNHLRVYDRGGEACRVCSGKIKRIALGNRSAFYCPSCQT